MTQAATPPPPAPTAATSGVVISRIGATAIVSLAALRATVSPEPLPWFDTDPFSPLTIPMTGPGPAGMLLMDVMTALVAGLVLLVESRRATVAGVISVMAALAGAGMALWHGLPGPDIENLRLGATWIAAILGALALSQAARNEQTRRLAFGIAIGVVALLAARGVVEYTLEHDRTVANFEANRAAILESRGWSEDSTMARAFERRLRQREASAWFGLTNVYATVVAGAFAGLVGLAVAGWREARSQRPALADGWPGALTAGAVAAGVALWMSRSRGGMLAAAIGLGMVALGLLVARRRGLGRLGGPAAVAVVPLMMGLIALQGALGTRAGDLSLLFRWFYFRTAAAIFGAEPLVGVGPAGFQAAYQLHKPAVSPEDVSDPHNLPLALLATLGVGGVAWVGLWVAWLWRSGGALWDGREGGKAGGPGEGAILPDSILGKSGATPGRPEFWLVLGACSIPTLVGAWLEQPAMTPEAALVRIVGLLGWVGVAWGVIVVARGAGGLALAASATAVAMAAQSLIDMAGTFQTSCCLVLATLGIAAAGAGGAGGAEAREGGEGAPGGTAAPPTAAARWRRALRRGIGVLGPAGVLAVGTVLLVGGLLPVWRWEQGMTAAGREAYVASQMTRRINNALGPQASEPAELVLRDLARAVGGGAARDPVELERQLTLLHLAQGERAVRELRGAIASLGRPHQPTQRALSQTLMAIAETRLRLGERQTAALAAEEAERAALAGARSAQTASAWSWVAVVLDHTADLMGDPTHRGGAIAALRRAVELNPHSATLAWRLFAALDAAREEEAAAEWAQRALELDELASLDPEGAGLTESQRERAKRAVEAP